MHAYLDDVTAQYRQHKQLAERAIAQVSNDADLFAVLGPEDNSIAIIIKHVAGNLRSRWTDFLTTDGEKPDRRRDLEFEHEAGETRASLLARWAVGWRPVFDTLEKLKPEDLSRTVHVRSEPLPVVQAINRNLTHTAYHVGQLVFLAKHFVGDDWRTLSVPRSNTAR
jgi:Protein of unknown function (DUF1572)